MRAIGIILAGGNNNRMRELSNKRAIAAMPIAGSYRSIDFALSNMASSHIQRVAVLTQYNARSLNEHLSSSKWWDFGRKQGGLFVFTPTITKENSLWYQGTADAIYQNLNFIDMMDPEYVLILSGDHIYTMDYSKMLDVHRANKADATIGVFEVPWDEAPRFGIMNTDAVDGRIIEFEEKPAKPKSNLASMGIYIFNREFLSRYLIADAADENSSHDFGKNIIPAMLADKKKLYAWTFDGYWKDVGTVESLWQANMDLLDDKELDLYNIKKDWKIYSEDTLGKPQLIGKDASVKNSLVTQGCVVNGEVEGSVLFNNVNVGEGAKVIDSVLMPGVLIEEGAVVKKAIIDEGVVVKAGTVVNDEAKEVALVSDNGR